VTSPGSEVTDIDAAQASLEEAGIAYDGGTRADSSTGHPNVGAPVPSPVGRANVWGRATNRYGCVGELTCRRAGHDLTGGQNHRLYRLRSILKPPKRGNRVRLDQR